MYRNPDGSKPLSILSRYKNIYMNVSIKDRYIHIKQSLQIISFSLSTTVIDIRVSALQIVFFFPIYRDTTNT